MPEKSQTYPSLAHLALANLKRLEHRISERDLTLSQFDSLKDAILFQSPSLSPQQHEHLLDELSRLSRELRGPDWGLSSE